MLPAAFFYGPKASGCPSLHRRRPCHLSLKRVASHRPAAGRLPPGRCAPAALLPLPETPFPGNSLQLVFLGTDPHLRPSSTRVAALLPACLHPSCSSGGLRGSRLGAAGPAQPSGARAGAGPRPPQARAGSHPSIQGRSLAGSVDLDLPCIPPTHGWGPCVCVKWARLGEARPPFQNPLSVCFGRSCTGDGR